MQLKSRVLLAFIAGYLALASESSGHHSFAAFYDLKIVTELDGELTRLLWNNPHVRFTVRVKDEKGQERLWEIETNSVSILGRMGLTPDIMKVGDRVKVAGNPGRASKQQMFAHSVLLKNGQEVVLAPGEKPRWSNRTVGNSGPWLASAGKASDPQRGIFRVWSSSLSGPWLFPDDTRYPLTTEAQAALSKFDPVKNYPLRNCTPKGMPTIMEQPYPMQFIQQGTDIVLRMEEYDTVRTIHMQTESGGKERPRSLLGYSVGKWEGTTLVVMTSGIKWPHFDAAGIPLSDRAGIVERFAPTADGSRLDYQMTVADPMTFTKPAVLRKHWLSLPNVEVRPYKCTQG
jgi:hypothetical protein